MVLYVESLKANVVNFIQVATMLRDVLNQLGIKQEGFEGSMVASRENLVVLDGLLAAGITEVEVPQR